MSTINQNIAATLQVPVGWRRQISTLVGMLCLVWLLAFSLGGPGTTAATPPAATATVWLSAPDQTEPLLVQAQHQRNSPQLFLHAKQQPLYVLVAEPVVLLLHVLALLMPLVSVLAWFIRAGPRRSFRLALWRDANLCHKNQLYDALPLLHLKN